MGTCAARGVSAFRPSDQTQGAIANFALTASSSSIVVATGRGMEPPTTLAINDALANDGPESSNDNLSSPTTFQPSPTVFSAISKRKHSALDDDASASSYSSKRTGKSTSSSASALHGIKDMMAGISSSMRDGSLGQRRHRRSSAERRIEATTLLQQQEDLTVDQMVAFADLFEQTTARADTYMALVREDVRKHWVQKQLVELGFPMECHGSVA